MAVDPFTAGFEVLGKVIDRVWADPGEAAAAKLKLVELQQTGELQVILGQLNVNAVEAANQSVFVAGWRPAVGWICACGLAYKFLLAPFVILTMAVIGKPITLPVLDFNEMLTLLIGMLGIGGYRTLEKIKGVDNPQ